MLRFDRLGLRRGSKHLFHDIDLTLHPGSKIGIVGANGTGKSSLFALIRGELAPEAGSLSLPSDWVVAHVAQETPASAQPAIDYVMDGDRELRTIEAQLAEAEQADDGERQATLFGRLENIGGYTARARAARLMSGLGFVEADRTKAVSDFSGGWRVRLNLAQALMCRSDLLLLDEPTNHLDLEAVLWLEEWLRAYPGVLLLISHDRAVLDRVVGHIAHAANQTLTRYTGNYSAFERLRAEQLAAQQAAHDKQQKEIARLQAFVARFRANASKARQAQSRLKAMERMTHIAPAHVDALFEFSFSQPVKLPNPLLRLDKVTLGYDRPFLGPLTLGIAPGDRIGLLGMNGCGKSTLIKALAGELAPWEGTRLPAENLCVGYFAQHQLEQLNPQASPLQHLQRLAPKAKEQHLRDYIGGFGFHGDQAIAPVAPLSGGEKARLVLALLVYQGPNLLLLDEPTNHLDLDMRYALSMALQDFRGALVVVSHDRHRLSTVTDTLWQVADGAVQSFAGDLDDYAHELARRRAQEAPATGTHTAASRQNQRRAAAQKRQQLQPLRQEVTRLEKNLAQLYGEQAAVNRKLADPQLYDEAHKARLKELLAEQARLAKVVEETETAWLTASERLETQDEAANC